MEAQVTSCDGFVVGSLFFSSTDSTDARTVKTCPVVKTVLETSSSIERGMHKLYNIQIELQSIFHLCGCPVKVVHASLGVRKDAENSFHHCGGLPDPVCVSGRSLKACVNLVQASLGVKKGLESKCQHPCESL